MDESEREALSATLGPLLRALDALEFIARHCHPPQLGPLLSGAMPLAATLAQARPRLAELPDYMAGIAEALGDSMAAALTALAELSNVTEEDDVGIRKVYRALRHAPAALAAAYPLAGILPPVNRFFLQPGMRDDAADQARFLRREILEDAGVMHFGGEPGTRGGFSLYVPEDYSPDVALPLVVALHGGSGDGGRFLWSWLRAARTHGAIVAAPSSTGSTWALSGEDQDAPNLARIVEFVREGWSVDASRMLLTGMSDGGTFTLLSGLDPDSPFTHLAPVSSAFHPMFVEMVDADRLNGLPVFIAHGELDWMFPVHMARGAQQALAAAGANVTYREVDDLSHCYPIELNGPMLEWMAETAR